MVRVGTSVNQEQGGEEQEPSWTGLIRDAVKDFVDAISDSTRQLATAAERFATDSLHLIDDATIKAQESADSSSDMADAARKAAEEARKAAETLQTAVIDAGDKIRQETRATVDEALTQAREAQAASERAKAEMQEQAAEILRRIEHSNEGGQEVVRAAQAATDEVRQAAERVAESAGGIDAAVSAAHKASEEAQSAALRAEQVSSDLSTTVAGARQSADEARALAEQMQRTTSDVTDAVTAAQKAAEEARQAAETIMLSSSESTTAAESSQQAAHEARQAAEQASMSASAAADRAESAAGSISGAVESSRQAAEEARQLAQQASSSPGFGQDAHTLLERLEDDYQLLTTLVQELAGRISSVTDLAAAQVEQIDQEPAIETEAPVYEPPAAEAEVYSAPSWTPALAPAFGSPANEPVAESEPEMPVWPREVIASEEQAEVASTEEATWVAPSWSTEEAVSEQEPYSPPAVQEPAFEAPAAAYLPPTWTAEPLESEPEAPFWRDVPVEEPESGLETWTAAETSEPAAAPVIEPSAEEDLAPPEQATWVPEPVSSYEAQQPVAPAWPVSEPETLVDETATASEEEAAPAAAPAPEATLFGRVQVTISPVPDFDRLLNLDSALSRVGSVQSVTLADYAQEEVTFRIDLASPLAAADFAQQVGESSGFSVEVTSAEGSAVTLRLG